MYYKQMLTAVLILSMSSYAFAVGPKDPKFTPQTSEAAQPVPVDLVICLDTSGSMTQLIDSARSKLWNIVNELAKVEQNVVLRVGLLTYGSPNLSTDDQGFVVFQSDLTRDLDTIYDKMMKMTTNGGDEYVGWVLHDAVKKMNWSSDPGAMKMIFVCGNESADQARAVHDFRTVSSQAGEQAIIIINAIYAGQQQQGISENWHEVGRYGLGEFFAINTAAGIIQIDAPQDQELARLNISINATYIPYGLHGEAGRDNQLQQDGNAQIMGNESFNCRNVAKASSLYFNGSWDLVDAVTQEGFKLEEVDVNTLPENMQHMTPEERKCYIEGRRAERETIQKQILELAGEREAYLKEAYKKVTKGTSLDDAIRQALHKQAARKGLTFSQ